MQCIGRGISGFECEDIGMRQVKCRGVDIPSRLRPVGGLGVEIDQLACVVRGVSREKRGIKGAVIFRPPQGAQMRQPYRVDGE